MSKDTSSSEYLVLKTEVRSLLISSQQGCDVQQLLRDYAAYNGRKEIPFREMGFRSLIELLTSMPDVARIDQTRDPIIIHGIADKTTQHIKNFVMTQKKKKIPRTLRGGANRNYYGNTSNSRTNGSSAYSRNQQLPYNSRSGGVPFQPYTQLANAHRNQRSTFDASNPSTQQYSNTSFPTSAVINNSVYNENHPTAFVTNKTSATRTVASFPPKSDQTPSTVATETPSVRITPSIDDNSSVMDDDCNYSEEDELAAYDVQQASKHGEEIILLRKRIRQLLLKFSSGLWLSSVHKLYQKTFDEELKLEDFQLKNLMALFDCVSDFVNSERDRRADSTDRILLLKPAFTEATKREQHTLHKTESHHSLSSLKENAIDSSQDPVRLSRNRTDRPIVDLSSFVPLNFHYNQLEYKSDEPFDGFLGDVEDPWNIHIGNTQFIPERDRLMAQLQDHYEQSSDQSIYVIPFEQLEVNLPCVYLHTNKIYYRAFIREIKHTLTNNIGVIKVYLVDYGRVISDINYHLNSTNLKFLHKNLSSMLTQVYECRLANVHYPRASMQWPDDARQFIVDSCLERYFSVQIVGCMNSSYCIYLWSEQTDQRSINELLIDRSLATELDDSQYSEYQAISPKPERYLESESKLNNQYIDENLMREKDNHMQYTAEENNLKHFVISIEHAYYLAKHPFTRRPCLPCFELARLLHMNESSLSKLNLVRATEVSLAKPYGALFNELHTLAGSRGCPHINRDRQTATTILYDLSAVRDHLCKIKFKEGDVIDAFLEEYNDYERPGYWNETKNRYKNKENLQSHQEALSQRSEIFNFRKEQLVSLSKHQSNISARNEMQEIDQELKNIHQKLNTMESILPSLDNQHSIARPVSTASSSAMKIRTSNKKMRETLYRIARPFDQQFSLNVCFQHRYIDEELFKHIQDEDLQERFEDLHRIAKNVLQFFNLEPEIADDNDRYLLNKATGLLPHLIETNASVRERTGIYNYCFRIVEHFQPIIRNYVQRTALIDTIY